VVIDKKATVNGQAATAVGANFVDWEVTIADAPTVSAFAGDEKGNEEKLKHEVKR
jgi:hypothetical protein